MLGYHGNPGHRFTPSNNIAKKGRVLTFGGPVVKVYMGALMIKVK